VRLNPGILPYKKAMGDRSPWPFYLDGSRRFLQWFLNEGHLSAYAEDHGLWPWMNAKRITFRSLVRRRVCFGGFRRRTWRYHGLCPWGSIV